MFLKKRILIFLKQNIIVIIAVILALFSMCLVGVDEKYLSYFDVETLTCLFCMLAVVCAMKRINLFEILACKIIRLCKNMRMLILVLTYITFIASMLIANDMALITFLPLSFIVLKKTGKLRFMAITFIMQNISANLGGMLTPFGNPQNLYLFSYFNISAGQFVQIMFIPFMVSIALITAVCMFVKPVKLEVIDNQQYETSVIKSFVYILLFALSIIIVFRVLPFYIGLIIIPVVIAICDYKSLLKVDYGLLLTFVSFFVFAGNLARIDVVNVFLSQTVNFSPLLVGTLSCQLISNVPSAILLSKFTSNYAELLVAVNIGGVGTLISSLASLITLREYSKNDPKGVKKYIGIFSLINFSLLIILLAVGFLMFYL